MPAATGHGEPSATLALLWRDRRHGEQSDARSRGPARSRAVDDVVAAATRLADQGGVEAVTMRAVAAQLGMSPMSVYTYVPGKAELLDLMVDEAYLGMTRKAWRRSQTWRRRATLVAEANRGLLVAHPWLTEVAALSRPPLGPGVMAKYEHELAAFDGTGLDDVTTDAALSHLLAFVQGWARSARDAERGRVDSERSDAEWWAANEALLARALDPTAYPRAVKVGAAAGAAQGSAWSPEAAWRFGLARTLDGLGALVDARERCQTS